MFAFPVSMAVKSWNQLITHLTKSTPQKYSNFKVIAGYKHIHTLHPRTLVLLGVNHIDISTIIHSPFSQGKTPAWILNNSPEEIRHFIPDCPGQRALTPSCFIYLVVITVFI